MNLFYLEIGLMINQLLYDEKEITIDLFTKCKNEILKRMI